MIQPIRTLESPEDLERAYSVMRELRQTLRWEDFLSLYKSAKEHDHYEIVGITQDGRVVAVMGYRILFDFVHGKHVYIDDLVTTESCRSKGYGAQLLSFAEEEAKRQGCQGLRLCTGVENESGKRFYERHDWAPRALAYKKQLKAPGLR
jgi:GNAT superfamily N-acetyltransferase